MKNYLLLLLFMSVVFTHDPNKEELNWKYYYRFGSVFSETPKFGTAGYTRLKRTTKHTFHDVRLFAHIFKNDTEIKIRHKSSRRFLTLDKFYSFNTLIYEKNTIINVDLRYHYNQGLGYFLKNRESGNMTLEIGVAFDNSDYLNNEQKTAYIRTAYSIDQDLNKFSGKCEIDYYHQVSNIVDSTNLSRFQILTELKWNLRKNSGIITGFTCDIHNDDLNPSVFLALAVSESLNWDM